MKNFELNNKISTKSLMILSISFFVILIIFAVFVIPDVYQSYLKYPNSPEARMPLQMIMALFTGLFILFIFMFKSLTGRKIKVEDSLIYFMKKSNGGFGNWRIDNIIDSSNVEIVKSREKRVYTGKAVIIYYWLIFEMKNGSPIEIMTNGWDFEELKKLFYYLRGKYPKIKFNNFLLKDSSEKLSGLDELMNTKS
jgi:amino acid transporter